MEMIVPPDGGWGWVIVAASFLCNLVVDGIMFSFGVFLQKIMEQFDVNQDKASLAGSLQTGFYLMAGMANAKFSIIIIQNKDIKFQN